MDQRLQDKFVEYQQLPTFVEHDWSGWRLVFTKDMKPHFEGQARLKAKAIYLHDRPDLTLNEHLETLIHEMTHVIRPRAQHGSTFVRLLLKAHLEAGHIDLETWRSLRYKPYNEVEPVLNKAIRDHLRSQ